MLAIRIIFKIFAVPLFLIVGTPELLFKLLTNLSSYVIGPLLFFILVLILIKLHRKRHLHASEVMPIVLKAPKKKASSMEPACISLERSKRVLFFKQAYEMGKSVR